MSDRAIKDIEARFREIAAAGARPLAVLPTEVVNAADRGLASE